MTKPKDQTFKDVVPLSSEEPNTPAPDRRKAAGVPSAERDRINSGGRTQFIVPTPEKVDEAGHLPVTVIETLRDLVSNVAEGRAAVLGLQDPRILKCFIEYTDLLETTPVVLSGYPGAVYSAAFDQATWQLDRVSYDTLMTEIASADRVATIKKDEAGAKPRPAPLTGPTRDITRRDAPRFSGFKAFDSGDAAERNAEDALDA